MFDATSAGGKHLVPVDPGAWIAALAHHDVQGLGAAGHIDSIAALESRKAAAAAQARIPRPSTAPSAMLRP